MQHRHGKLKVVAFGWLQPRPGVWERWMVRQCGICRDLDPMLVVYVDVDYDMCASCLSQHLHPDEADPRLVVCVDCGMRTPSGTQLEPDDDDDEAMPDRPNRSPDTPRPLFDTNDDDPDEPWKRK